MSKRDLTPPPSTPAMIRNAAFAAAIGVVSLACGDGNDPDDSGIITPMPPMPAPFDAGGDGGPSDTDAGFDAGPDGTDAGDATDDGFDSGVIIAPMPPPFDAGSDSGSDAGHDAGRDATVIAPMPPPMPPPPMPGS